MATATWIQQPKQMQIVIDALKYKSNKTISGMTIYMDAPVWIDDQRGYFTADRMRVTFEFDDGKTAEMPINPVQWVTISEALHKSSKQSKRKTK